MSGGHAVCQSPTLKWAAYESNSTRIGSKAEAEVATLAGAADAASDAPLCALEGSCVEAISATLCAPFCLPPLLLRDCTRSLAASVQSTLHEARQKG